MLSPILSVQDIDTSVSYYTEKLGFEHAWTMADDDGASSFACVKLGTAEILLGTIDFVEEDKRANRGIGIQLYIELPKTMDVNSIYEHAKSSGADIVRDLEDRDWGERVFTVNDVDGFNLMIAQRIKTSDE